MPLLTIYPSLNIPALHPAELFYLYHDVELLAVALETADIGAVHHIMHVVLGQIPDGLKSGELPISN